MRRCRKRPLTVAGVKVTRNDALAPAFTTSGKVMPLTENPFPLQLPEDTLTAEPLAVSFTVRVALLPTVTFPKSIVGTETAREPAVVCPSLPGLVCCEVRPPPQPTSAATRSTINPRQHREIAIHLAFSPYETVLSRPHKDILESTTDSVLS